MSKTAAWRATSWFLKRIPEAVRGQLAIEALRKTRALSVAAILIDLNDPAQQRDRDAAMFDPALDLDTVEAMKREWLLVMRSRAAGGGELISEPDLMYQLYRWRAYAGSLDEPRAWVMAAIQTDEGFANMATQMMSRGTRQTIGDRVSTPYNTFNREAIADFVGLDAAKARCDAINPGQFPEHEEALRTLHRSLELWLGLRERSPFDH